MKNPANLVLATGGVLTAAAIIDEKKRKSTGSYHDQNRLAKKLVAIVLLTVVLSFTVDQVPEFGGPLALLILVSGLLYSANSFSWYFNQTQGNTK